MAWLDLAVLDHCLQQQLVFEQVSWNFNSGDEVPVHPILMGSTFISLQASTHGRGIPTPGRDSSTGESRKTFIACGSMSFESDMGG